MILLTLFSNLLLSGLTVSHPLHEREDEVQERAIFQETGFIIDQHSRARELMIALEKTQRQDAQFRDGLSPACKQADRIVKKIREEDIKVHWNGSNGFAGEMFPLARSKISNTTLWKIVKGMPKGALLHAHLSAMLPYNTLLSAIIKADMLFQANESLGTPEGRQRATVTFWPPAYAVKNVDITSEDYKGQRVNISQAIVQFPRGESAFREFVVSKLVVPPKVATQHELGVDEIWRRFQPLFSSASTFFTYQPVVQVFWQNLFAELAEDKISWVEIRSGGSTSKLIKPDATVSDDVDGKQWWDLMVQELEKFSVQHNSTWQQERRAPFYGARVIWSDQRGKPTADILKSMRSALDMKKNYRKLFSGYDLVSQEDLGRTLLDLAPELLWFQQQAKEDNLIMPFFFHAGETLGDGNSTDLNLFDAVLLGTRRIGHGFSLYKHPELIQAVKKKNIMVEVCPISNEVLQLSTDILHHPLPAMIAHGVTTALSNDDPAMLGQEAAGLSYDFYQVIQGFDNVGLAGLGALAQNSLRWSNFEDQDDKEWGLDIELGEVGMGTKGLRIKEWNSLFDAYCHEIVNKHNGTYGG
ncbi:adenosine/AMP deaminase [Colletotrichum orchidophilum]|uniref:adenosine deaminase n=1 Tax=Colletotrichum orchidophilum TaxID=1209926 RepID=A0A1G4BRM8_9PEZI|nr:adenosine/AMP deaminase [Colletotrichum orchidophilum]OHF03937.1 adenosine/AMP deaminase [Colletotrichum orchidophilum]